MKRGSVLALVAAVGLWTSSSFATQRTDFISQADVWLNPSWISADFKFSSTFNVHVGPLTKEDREVEDLLRVNQVVCQTTQELLDDRGSGETPKFRCNLMKYNEGQKRYEVLLLGKSGKPQKLKVKYGSEEVFAEVVGTRLLWALGFGADRMFAVNKTYCYGCSPNPFKHHKLDPNSLATPRSFGPTAIELKLDGEEIDLVDRIVVKSAGKAPDSYRTAVAWQFGEAMDYTSKDPARKVEQLTHRQALRLLSAIMAHVDNKGDNHRLVCTEKYENGKCDGKVLMMIQDIGATFGKGFSLKDLGLVKFDLRSWAKRPVWDNPKTCVAKLGMNAEELFFPNPKITEEGRQFLAKLLTGFSEGPEGRKRVEDLFRSAQVEENGKGSVAAWTDAFMSKVEQVTYPMGRSNPNFQCPKRLKR